MNATRRTAATLLLFSLPLVGFVQRDDAVAFEPSEGLTVEKSLALEASFYLDDLSMVFDGQEMPTEQMGSFDEALSIGALIEVTDEYVNSGSGRMLTLIRSYDDLSLEAGPESDVQEQDEFGELAGSSVVFKWDEDAEEYVKSYHESEGNDELLENLDVDMDFLVLLPEDEVSEGDTWEASGSHLGTLFFPGGVPADPGSDAEAEGMEEMKQLFEDELESQFKEAFGEFVVNCTYKGTRDEGDAKLGVIEFKFEGEADIDLTELILAAIDLQAGEMGIEADVTAGIGLEFEGEGSLLWNLSAGHVAGYEMNSDMVVTFEASGEIDAMGDLHSVEISMEASGESAWKLETSTQGE